MTVKMWPELNVGDVYQYARDPANSIWIKCACDSSFLVVDRGSKLVIDDKQEEQVIWFDEIDLKAYLGSQTS